MVQKLIELITNPVFFSAGASWFTAQVLKTVITIIKNHGFSPEALVASGGMPSTHTAMVTGLTVSAFLTYGPGGFEFPMAFFFAMVVIYDSRKVRYETGLQGKILNHIAHRERSRDTDPYFKTVPVLDEAAGHTSAEVAAGLALGTVVALAACCVIVPALQSLF